MHKLDGALEMPVPADRNQNIPEQPAIQASESEVDRGERLYNQSCMGCHGFFVHSGGMIPDLRMMDKSTHQDFNTIVRDGLLRLNGMPGFAGELTNQDFEQIYAYIVTQANKDRRKALEDEDSD